MSRERNIKILIYSGIAVISIALIGLLIYFVYSDGKKKALTDASSDIAINSVEAFESFDNPKNYLEKVSGEKQIFTDELYKQLFSDENIKQMQKLKSELGYRSELKINSVEIISKSDTKYVYRLKGVMTEYYDKTNETQRFPESYLVEAIRQGNTFVVSKITQEDDVDND